MLAIAPGWELEVDRGPDWLLVRVRCPDCFQSDPPPLAEVLWELLERHFTYRLVLELDELHVLSSSLIGQLVRLYKMIREHDGVMRICGLSAYNCQVLRTCHLEDRLVPFHDRHEAVMGSHNPRRPR